MITEGQSFAYDVRDAMYNILVADAYFASWTHRKTKMMPVQTQFIPYLGVYILDEIMLPDGDANAGCIRFNHTARIGFSAIQAANLETDLEGLMDESHLKIMSLLWTNANLMNLLKATNPEGVGIESIPRGSRRHIFGATGTNNEFPFGELQYEVSCFSRSEWYPDITDTLDEIDVVTGIKISEVQADRDKRQQVTIKMMFDALREGMRRN